MVSPRDSVLRRVVWWGMLILGTAILCGLGAWQLARLSWKTQRLHTMQVQLAQAPRPWPGEIAVGPSTDSLEAEMGFRPVQITGQWQKHAMQFVYQVGDGSPHHTQAAGYRLLVPLRFAPLTSHGSNAPLLLVDLGWVPSRSHTPYTDLAWYYRHWSWLDEPAQLACVLTPGEKPWIKPPQPSAPHSWTWVDLASLAVTVGEKLLPLVCVLPPGVIPEMPIHREPSPSVSKPPFPLPIGRVMTPALRNDHLGYALTWFALAGIWLLVCWTARHCPGRSSA